MHTPRYPIGTVFVVEHPARVSFDGGHFETGDKLRVIGHGPGDMTPRLCYTLALRRGTEWVSVEARNFPRRFLENYCKLAA